MAHFLTLFSVLILVAVFNPDKLEFSASAMFTDRHKRDDGGEPTCVDEDFDPVTNPICKEVANYPNEEEIEVLVEEKYSDLIPFFKEETLPPQNLQFNNSTVKEYLCDTIQSIIHPEGAVNNENDWFLVINTPKLKQGILVEECRYSGETCGASTGLTLPNQYNATCEQQFVFRSVYGYRQAKVIKEFFKFPSCCKCALVSG